MHINCFSVKSGTGLLIWADAYYNRIWSQNSYFSRIVYNIGYFIRVVLYYCCSNMPQMRPWSLTDSRSCSQGWRLPCSPRGNGYPVTTTSIVPMSWANAMILATKPTCTRRVRWCQRRQDPSLLTLLGVALDTKDSVIRQLLTYCNW